MIIISDDSEEIYLYNKARLQEGFIPASTFKIANTLIALEENIISTDTIYKWDGVQREYPAWNQDQTLKSAFDTSCVWCYQGVAKKIGEEKYRTHLKKLGYGNQKPTPELTTFWLNGDLRISSMQQIDFLKQIFHEDLPYRSENIRLLKQVMLQEKTPRYTLSAKTGFSLNTGWYVGYITVAGKTWFFATNIEINNMKELELRKKLTIEALKARSII